MPIDELFLASEEENTIKTPLFKLLQFIWSFLKKYIKRIIIALFFIVISSALSLICPLLIRHAIDVELTSKNLTGLFLIVLLYLALQPIILLANYFQGIELFKVSEKAGIDLKEKIYAHAINLPVSYFDKNRVGQIMTKVENDSETLKTMFTGTAVVLITDFLLFIGMSAVMITINYKLYLFILAFLVPIGVVFLYFQKKIRGIYTETRKKVANINSFINESVKGLPVLQAFCRENVFAKKMDSYNREKFEKELKAIKSWNFIWFFIVFGEDLCFVVILFIGGLWAIKGAITIGTLFLFVDYIVRMFSPLTGISEQLNVVQRAFASADRILTILNTSTEADEKNLEKLSFSKKLKMEGINFAYINDNWVLKNISLEINKGEKIAIVGETGGGKTTIAGLLLKFYSPQKGNIFVDDVKYSSLGKKVIGSLVAYVPQDLILFPGNIIENLRLFDESVPKEKVYESAKRCKIHDTILQFSQGYETNIIDRGINLSVGQRQLLAFVRALVFDKEIIILDEATSSVDPHTEHLIQEGIQELLKERTAIIIAHRLSTIQIVDKIIVLHNGKIIEEGSHKVLLKKGGFYSKLHKLQYLGVN